jgi:hypothetical protein
MKLRLKDTQLVRAQNRVKELEKQIEDWKKTGVITNEAATESTSAPAASSSAPAAPAASASAPSPTTAVPVQLLRGVVLLQVFRVNLLLRSPPLANLRGVVVREILVFGAAAPGAGRGANAPQGWIAGVAVTGSVSKKSREEGEVSDGGLTFQTHEARRGRGRLYIYHPPNSTTGRDSGRPFHWTQRFGQLCGILARWPAHCLRFRRSNNSCVECHDGRDSGRPFHWTHQFCQFCGIFARWSGHHLRFSRWDNSSVKCYNRENRDHK